jgi:hypothetical protein
MPFDKKIEIWVIPFKDNLVVMFENLKNFEIKVGNTFAK